VEEQVILVPALLVLAAQEEVAMAVSHSPEVALAPPIQAVAVAVMEDPVR
jgi:hypothetical protein